MLRSAGCFLGVARWVQGLLGGFWLSLAQFYIVYLSTCFNEYGDGVEVFPLFYDTFSNQSSNVRDALA